MAGPLTNASDYTEAQRKRDLAILWHSGELDYRLHSSQLELLDEYRESTEPTFVVCCSRQWGKSTWAVTLSVMECLQRPGIRVRYVTGTKSDARDIIEPSLSSLLDECPPELRPTHAAKSNRWTFPNGSEIILAGTDGKGAERLRGLKSDLIIVDEAAFIDDLTNIVESVMRPGTIHTNGRIILISTPPYSAAHPFVSRYMTEAEANGTLRTRTIYDNPLLSKEQRDRQANAVGGYESSRFKREFMAQVCIDEDRAIVPEFAANEANLVVDSIPYNDRVDRYTVADFGFKDCTVIGFWEYHWIEARLYLVSELEYTNTGATNIAPQVLQTERQLWGSEPPKARWADVPDLARRDMGNAHDLWFAKVDKVNKEGAINRLRQLCTEQQIGILSSCTTTISHLKHGVWSSSRKDFARSSEHGHFDAIDMCIYAARMITRGRMPAKSNVSIHTHHVPNKNTQLSDKQRALKNALRPARRGRR